MLYHRATHADAFDFHNDFDDDDQRAIIQADYLRADFPRDCDGDCDAAPSPAPNDGQADANADASAPAPADAVSDANANGATPASGPDAVADANADLPPAASDSNYFCNLPPSGDDDAKADGIPDHDHTQAD